MKTSLLYPRFKRMQAFFLVCSILIAQGGANQSTTASGFTKIPIESSAIVSDSYGSLLTVESLSVSGDATRIDFRADNIRDKSVSICPAVPSDNVGNYAADHFIIDDRGKRYHFKSESQIYQKTWWKLRECIDIAPGSTLRFSYEFERLDPGVVNITLHRQDGIFPIRLLDNRVLGSNRQSNQLHANQLGFRIKSGSPLKFADGLIVSIEAIRNANQRTAVTFRAQATRPTSVCAVEIDEPWPREYLQHFIGDGTGDHYEFKQDLTTYPTSTLGGKDCRGLAQGEVTYMTYAFRRLERPVPKIDIHFKHQNQTAIFPVELLDSFPPTQPGEQFDLSPISCNQEGTLKSMPSTASTSIRFMNRGTETRSIYWLDTNGTRNPYKTLEPGQSYVQHTFTGHLWIITTEFGACSQIFKAQQTPATAILH